MSAAALSVLTRGTYQSNSTNTGAASLSVTLPADLMPGDHVLLFVVLVNTATPGQSAGLTLAEIPIDSQVQGGSRSILMGAVARGPASAGAGVSQDAGTTITMTSTNSTTSWAIGCRCIRRGYSVFATAYNEAVQSLSGTGQSSYGQSGVTPTFDHCRLLTFFAFSSDSNNVAQSFPATVAITGGGTDDRDSTTITAQTSGQRTRGLAIYFGTGSLTTGVAAATRTVTMVTGGTLGSIHGWSVAIRPMAGATNDVLMGEGYKTSPDDAVRQVFDLFYPSVAYSTARPWVLAIHGGTTTGSRYIDLTKHLITQELMALGFAVAWVEWRLPTVGVRGGDESMFDIHTCLRYLIANAASYNLDPAQVRIHGSSAGASRAFILSRTLNDTDWYGPTPENAATVEICERLMCWFPGSNNLWSDQWKTDLSIANPQPNCASGSQLGIAYSTDGNWYDACANDSWDADVYPRSGASKDITDSERNNIGDPAWWALYGGTTPPVRIAHGDADQIVPYKCTNHDGSGGRPPGFYQNLKGHGTVCYYHELAGAGHGGAGFYPSAQAGHMYGDLIDEMIAWLANGTAVTGDPTPVRRRRRSSRDRILAIQAEDERYSVSRLGTAFHTGSSPGSPLPQPGGAASPLGRAREGRSGRRWVYIP